MNINIQNQTFIVGGATAGFGKATTEHLINEGATVIGIARSSDSLAQMADKHGKNFIALKGDITNPETADKIVELAEKNSISGILVNAGGPPAMRFEETTISDWDNAYRDLLRWKVDLMQKLVPYFKSKQYGRIVFVESSSVKQPIENLVLSTSLRLAVVGLMKTLSQEISGQNINFNIIAPGSHDTAAIERVIAKKSEMAGVSIAEAKERLISGIPAGKLGDAEKFGSLATWLLSPLSEFVTGQVYAVEGGVVKSSL